MLRGGDAADDAMRFAAAACMRRPACSSERGEPRRCSAPAPKQQQEQPGGSVERGLLYDAHCHALPDAAGVLPNEGDYAALGMKGFCVCATSEADWGLVQLAAARSRAAGSAAVSALGLHPWWVTRREEGWAARLRVALQGAPQCAVGEIGLDRCRDAGPAEYDAQLQCFAVQLQLAAELRRTAVVHCVRAFGDVHDALSSAAAAPHGLPPAVVFHSWTGSADAALRLLRLAKPQRAPPRQGSEFFFGFSAAVNLRGGGGKWRDCAAKLPPDRLLLESDLGTPSDLPPALSAMLRPFAELLQLGEQDAARRLAANAAAAFRHQLAPG
eukprot:TRINITY_DN15156_c0_g1_i1.p1 TRINITY_DN15156_c0_g1~~TRINITY_DN15156_c0_g1_i1.p1  ORF type:complete len:327 (+),score=90.40 TRINITY_DN15156_c0_g1_i1:92-1072(+)